MLDAAIKTQLTSYLERLQQPIELVASLDESADSAQVLELLNEIAECSPLVQVSPGHRGAVTPSFGIAAAGNEARVWFAGLPLGHEFTSLVLALLHVGGHPAKSSQDLLQKIRALKGPLRFETFISLSCHNCPDVVQALNLLAALSPGASSVTYDGALFQDEVTRRDVMAVPAIFLNGEPFASGRMSVEEIVAKLAGEAVQELPPAAVGAEPYDVLVVGGGPAGAAAAIYAARKGIRTAVVAERMGGQTNDTMGIENFVSMQETNGPKFAAALEAHVRQYNVDLLTRQRATKLVPAERPGGLAEVHLGGGTRLQARTIVVSTGARWRNLGVPGEDQYRNKGVAYCPHCDGPLFKGKRVAVVGGGNSGVEAAIDLAGLAAHVTLLEYGEQLKADAILVSKLSTLANVQVVLNAQTAEVLGDGSRVGELRYIDRVSGDERSLELEGVFVQIGLVPNTEFLRDTLELTEAGEIKVDAKGRTSAHGVFAAGDATTAPYKQIVVAAGDGAAAALSAFDHLIRTSAPAKA